MCRCNTMSRRKQIAKQCVYCGKWFIPTAANRKLCSPECQVEMQKIHWGENRYRRAKKKYEAEHPGEEYIPRKYEKKIVFDDPDPDRKKSDFEGKLKAYIAEGKDYVEEQKKQTIEMYARIKL